MQIPNVSAGYPDPAALAKGGEIVEAAGSRPPKAGETHAFSAGAGTTAMAEILSRYDVTDISPVEFSQMIQELFEARTPKGEAPIAEVAGKLSVDDSEATRRLVVTPDNGDELIEYPVTKRARLLVQDGESVTVGQGRSAFASIP